MNSKFKLIILFILDVYFFSFYTFCQSLIPLQNNPDLKYYIENNKDIKLKRTQVIDTLNLPFFDDFSCKSVFPDNRLWDDKKVFINNNFSVNPITYGVATFDALDENGNLYENISSFPVVADILTSKPIDLSTVDSYESLYLSFFYQCGGLGEKPEKNDSLVVEFFLSPDIWQRIWSSPGLSKTDTFYQVIISIPANFRKKGFRFRIKNYVSLSSEDFKGGEGAISNGDFWHVDYVRIFKGTYEEHSRVYDISIINNLSSSYTGYQSIPYSHIDIAGYKNFRQTMPVTIRTNNRPSELGEYVAIGLGYYFKDLKSNRYFLEPYVEGIKNLKFDTIITFHDTLITLLRYDNTDYAHIEIGAYLNNTPANDWKINDTVKRVEYYSNYYAYDDGTPEYGFGISGEGTYGAVMACRYKTFVEDTLRAIDIYFNKTKNNFNAFLPFKIGVWSMGPDSLPKNILNTEDQAYTYYPDPDLPWLKFQRIYLKKPINIKDYFFIGIIQLTEDFINVGYDINTNSKSNIVYNITGNWQLLSHSFKNGSLMIRPVFSKNPLSSVPEIKNNISEKISIYPNPAKEYFKINFNGLENALVQIYDLKGNLIKCIVESSSNIYNIEELTEGLYIVKIIFNDKIYQSRLIVLK